MVRSNKKKRERLEVIYDILNVIRESGNNIRPTRLLQKSNLSPQMFKEYINELASKEFVVKEDGSGGSRGEKGVKGKGSGVKFFCLTPKGFEFLSEYRVITAFIDNFGL